MFKAMIVDDEIDIREGLMNIIDWEKQGFVIVGQAANGLEALELFRIKRPSLVVTDIRMPEMDGIALIKELVDLEHEVKIIILSGYNDFTYAREAMKYGVTSYLLKPVDTDELCRELDSARENITSRLANKRSEAEKAESLKSLFLLKLTHNEIMEENILCNMEEYGLKLEYEAMCVVIAEFDHYREYEADCTAGEISLKKFTVKNIIEELLVKNNSGYLFEEAENRFGLLLGLKDAGSAHASLQNMLTEIADCVKAYSGEEISIGAGNIVRSPDGLHISYRQAIKTVDGKPSGQSGNIFYSRDMGPEAKTRKDAEHIIDKVLQYIKAHYDEEISLKKLSDLFYVNQFYLGQLLKKKKGMNFNDYLNNLRIENAKLLLHDEDLPIKEISERIGYKYVDHFYKNFKEITGVNPGEYRKGFRKIF